MKLTRLPDLKFVHWIPEPDRNIRSTFCRRKMQLLDRIFGFKLLVISHMCETPSFSRQYESSMRFNLLDRGVWVWVGIDQLHCTL